MPNYLGDPNRDFRDDGLAALGCFVGLVLTGVFGVLLVAVIRLLW